MNIKTIDSKKKVHFNSLLKKSKEYHECIDNDEHNPERNEAWCSLTGNYDRDKLWKYCDVLISKINLFQKLETKLIIFKLKKSSYIQQGEIQTEIHVIFHLSSTVY